MHFRIVLFFMGITMSGYAQFQDKIPQVAPIPPEAAAMFKVLERPLGTYTGTIPINFPLLKFNSGPLSANVSLNYNSTGGVRVEEIPSSVGLGFSLTDGAGRITQNIRGLPDDMGHGMLHSSRKPSTFNCSDMQDVWLSTIPYQWDLEPDVFMYEVNGKTGKFVFKEDGTIALSENDGIKIEYVFASIPTSGIDQWIITDEKGNKYYFGETKTGTGNARTSSEYTYESLTNPSNSIPGLSSRSWYLTETYDMNEENSLKYTYVNTGGQTITFSGGFRRFYPIVSACNGFNMNPDQAVVRTDMSEMMVSRIDGRDGYVLFNTAADRLDGTFSRKVNNIELYDSTGALKKRVKFNYAYFSAASGDPFIKRLKLKNFAEFGSSATDSISYAFEYEELQNLPSRLSNSVDFWGFFNNKFNPSFFPNLVYKYNGTTIRETRSADRSAVPGYAQANILKKIFYPTGGYREFVYEGNTALINSTNEHTMDPDYLANQSFTRTDFNFNTAPTACLTHNFTVNSTDGGTVFTYSLTGIGSSCNGYYVKLFKTTTAGDQFGGFELYNFGGVPSTYRDLVNGFYRLEVYKTSAACTFGSVNGSWRESTLNTATITTPNGIYSRNNREVGGVRIKEIRDFDPITNKISKTEYKYKLYSTDSTFTSGLLVSPVRLVSYQNPSSLGCKFLAVHTSSCYPLATQGGSYVVYPEVRTIENGNGWTDRLYNYTVDGYPAGFPLAPPPDNSHLRGRLMNERVYDQTGSLLRKTVYSYITGATPGQMGVKAKPYYHDIQDNGGEDREYPRDANEIPWDADCNTFYTIVGSYLPFSRTDSIFTPAGNHVTKIEYAYHNYNNKLLLKQEKVSVNNSAIKESSYKYPFSANTDFTFPLTAAEQTMKTTLLNKNYMQPLEKVDSLKPASGTGSLIGGEKYTFGTFNTSDIHLSAGRSYTAASDYTETNLSAYDVKGNLAEKYRTNDVKEVYLWGYGYNYPVAKVVGSTYSAVAALVNNSVIQNLTTTDATMRAELNNIRTGLAGTTAQVTTYTYKPGVGITSETDPSGKTLLYEYDVFGRLILVRDAGNNIVKKFEYKYDGAN